MSTDEKAAELESAIAEAELNEQEAEQVRELVGEGGQIAAAIVFVIGERETEDDDEPEQPAAGEELGEPTQAQLRRLEREQERHEKRVHEVMGAHVAGFEACEHCGGVGLLPPGPKPQSHSNYKACETCRGFGRVLTGSQRPGNEDVDCPTCRGRGYLEKLDQQGQPLVPDQPTAAAIAPVPVAVVALEAGDLNGGSGNSEQWGVPAWMGDPNLGK